MQLVEQCLGVTSVPGPVVEMIIEQAEGHPYFSEEIAFALRDAGLLVIENGESRLAPNVRDLRDVDFPNTVQDIIIGRFDRLSARQQSILKVASVIGREFSIDTLVEIYPVEMDAAEAVESLQSLAVLDLMQEVVLRPVAVSISPRHHPGHRLRLAPLLPEGRASSCRRDLTGERHTPMISTPLPRRSPTTGATA